MLINKKIVGTVAPMAGVPAVLTKWALSYAEMLLYSQAYVCGPDQMLHISPPTNSVHDIARNEIARSALGEFTLFLDTDHEVPADLLFRLLNASRRYDADVVTGLYLQRHPPYAPNIWRFDPNGTHPRYSYWKKGAILEVDCAGAGALLVKNAVFRRIWDELGEEPFSRLEFEQGKTVPTGEDFAFFRRCQRLGIQAICPTSVECPHLEIRPLRVGPGRDYDPDKEFERSREVQARYRQRVEEKAA